MIPSVLPPVILLLVSLSAVLQAATPAADLSTRYAAAREVELGLGTLGEAVSLYRALFPEAMSADRDLAATLLFRIGVCEREMGRVGEARQAWRQLVETYPPEHPVVARAREELKDLEREAGRLTIRGRVVDPRDQPIEGIYLLIGDWGNAPPLISGTNGWFQTERQAAGQTPGGDRYALFYAEHPVLSLTAMGVWCESTTSQVIRLRPSISIKGYVVDSHGRPVVGAWLRVTAVEDGMGTVPIPLGRLFPPLMTDTNGAFCMRGLAEGLRYSVSAEKDGYRSGRSWVEAGTRRPGERSDLGLADTTGLRENRIVHAAEIVLQPVGRISVDDSGILRAELNLNDPDERARLDEVLSAHDSESSGTLKPLVEAVSRPSVETFPYGDFPFALRWLRGDPTTDSPLNARDLKGHVVVFRFGSAYLDASLRRQFPNDACMPAQMVRLFNRDSVVFVWVLPASDVSEDAARVALETCVDLPIAVDGEGRMGAALRVMGHGGNIVVDRNGALRPPCTDQQVFKVLKDAMGR